jgi:sugar/nucleoside kinase (ribokinase family)
VVDTTGAGDAFAAAFIACELAGNPTDACLKAGIAAGAEAVTRIGGQPVAQGPASL